MQPQLCCCCCYQCLDVGAPPGLVSYLPPAPATAQTAALHWFQMADVVACKFSSVAQAGPWHVGGAYTTHKFTKELDMYRWLSSCAMLAALCLWYYHSWHYLQGFTKPIIFACPRCCLIRSSASDGNFGMSWPLRFGGDAPAASALHAKSASADAKAAFERSAQPSDYYGRDAREPYGKPRLDPEWPPCVGTCLAGNCKLDLSHPGCCYLAHNDYYERSELSAVFQKTRASTEAMPSYRFDDRRGQLICWEKGE